MSYGWQNLVLRINLSDGTIKKEELPEGWNEQYIGCRGIATRLMYDEVGPDVDPMGPGNHLIFATGALEGTPIGQGRMTIQCKHPTGRINEGGAGGEWGPMLKYAGYDHIIIEGEADSPVYILINNDQVEIRDAKHLWGKDTRETITILEDETHIRGIQVALIGAGGENGISSAKVQFNGDHSGGRGCGATMGRKKLKAIAVYGTGGVKVKNADKYLEAYRKYRKQVDIYNTTDAFNPNWGFMSANQILQTFNYQGWLHAYNAQRGTLIGFQTGLEYLSKYVQAPRAGYCCPYPACGRLYRINEGQYAGACGEEREGGFNFGCAIVAVTDLHYSVQGRDLCSKYGLDELGIYYTIGWAMECYEKGIIDKGDTEGIELKFGNGDALIQMIEDIAHKRGFGKILALGAHEAAKVIGKGSEKFLLTIKGQELECMPQRPAYQMALALAVSEAGADHTRWYPPYPPNPKTIPTDVNVQFDPYKAFQTTNPEDKGRLVKWLYDSRGMLEQLPTCVFTIRGLLGIDLSTYRDMFNACTGLDFSTEQCVKTGERIVNLERAYIVREGFTRKDDALPRRMMEEPVVDASIPPIGGNLDIMLNEYYSERKWDVKTAIPSEEKLSELGLDFAIPDMRKKRGEMRAESGK